MSDLDALLTAIRFHDIVREESRRTILCEPHREHQVRAVVDQAGAADVITVQASPGCPEGKLIVLDMGAFKAAEEEFMQSLTHGPWRFGR